LQGRRAQAIDYGRLTLHLPLDGVGGILSFFTSTFDVLANPVNRIARHVDAER
jgi:hypothetical protein